jgi:hypothetical protein
VMGPFATKDEAEKVGRASKRAYWGYEGSPCRRVSPADVR